MRILFPYLARWRSANRSRYHQILAHLCRLGHQVFVLKAPPMAVDDISSRDVLPNSEFGSDVINSSSEPPGLSVAELEVSGLMRSFFDWHVSGTKAFKKSLLTLGSVDQIRRFTDQAKIDVLLLYNLPQVRLLGAVDCHRHFDLADDLVEMFRFEHPIIYAAGGSAIARAVEKRLIRDADSVSVASSVLEEGIASRADLIPNGADLEQLDRADPSEWLSRNAGPTIGFVGAFEYWIDFDLVLGMAERMPKATFLLVGGGRRLEELRGLIARRGLSNVTLTGPLRYEHAMNLAAGMDLCLLPFTRDAVSDAACPLKLFEYAALRKPVISTRTEEVRRIGDGWIAFGDDAKESAAIAEDLLCNPRKADEAGEKGRIVVESTYNWPLIASRFADQLQRHIT